MCLIKRSRNKFDAKLVMDRNFMGQFEKLDNSI